MIMIMVRLGIIIVTTLVNISLFIPQSFSEDLWKAPSQWTKKKNPLPNNKKNIEIGKMVYEKNCNACHGVQGEGDGPLATSFSPPPADFSDAKKMTPQTDGELFWKISEGRKAMTSFKNTLKKKEIWTIIHYLRTFSNKKEEE